MRQLNRRAVTSKAIFRRLGDARLDLLTDRRDRRGRRYPHIALVYALALGCVAASRSLRQVEELTSGLHPRVRRRTRIVRRISDTKLRDALHALDAGELRAALHRQVKAEHRRGNLKPTRLPIGLVAIDGKGLGKLDSWGHPDVQGVFPEGRLPYGLARVHRAHLVSPQATVCIDQRPLPGDSNEIGAVCDFTSELLAAYRQADLFEAVIADAGNCSLSHGGLLHDNDLGYILALKEPSGDIYQEALRCLAALTPEQADCQQTRREKGRHVTHRLWRVSLPAGFLQCEHARQLIRIQRVTDKAGSTTEGDRYFVTNLPRGRLKSEQWLSAIRLYWRCENNGHWTADVVWREDATRTPWTRQPAVIYALALLRMLALNILAIMRAMTRREHCSKPPPWQSLTHAVQSTLATPTIFWTQRLVCD